MEDVGSNDPWDNMPAPMPVCDDDRDLVKLTGIPTSYKAKAWAQIQVNDPALAALLKDSEFKAVVEMFQADIFVDAEAAPVLPVYKDLKKLRP